MGEGCKSTRPILILQVGDSMIDLAINQRPLNRAGLAVSPAPSSQRLRPGSGRLLSLRRLRRLPQTSNQRAPTTMAAALPALPFAAAGGGPVGLFVLLASLLVGTFVMLPKRRRSGGIGQLPGPKQHPLLGNFLDLGAWRVLQQAQRDPCPRQAPNCCRSIRR